MKQSSQRKLRLFACLIKIGAMGYAGILCLIIISNTSVVQTNWPFGLFASFSDMLILAAPVVLLALVLGWRRAVLPMIVITALAFYPFFSFDKFVEPSRQDCQNLDCISVVSVNLRHNRDALTALSKTSAKDADVLVIVETPYDITSEDLSKLFPLMTESAGTSPVALLTKPRPQIGSRLAVLSRRPLSNLQLHMKDFPNTRLFPRGIIQFNYKTASGEPISFVAVHPPPPKARVETAARDSYLDAARKRLTDKENFVMLGDFNITPWEPKFAALPGQRAGDPRWTRTWNARKFWQRITIDHAMLGQDVGLAQTHIGPDVGSDHFPIHLTIYAKAVVN